MICFIYTNFSFGGLREMIDLSILIPSLAGVGVLAAAAIGYKVRRDFKWRTGRDDFCSGWTTAPARGGGTIPYRLVRGERFGDMLPLPQENFLLTTSAHRMEVCASLKELDRRVVILW